MVKKATRLTAEEVNALMRADDEPAEAAAPVEIRHVEFGELDASWTSDSPDPVPQNVDFVWDIPMAVEVVLGDCELTVRSVLDIHPGSVVALNQSYGEWVDILLNGRRVARGEVIIAGEQFGVKIKEILVSNEELDHLPE